MAIPIQHCTDTLGSQRIDGLEGLLEGLWEGFGGGDGWMDGRRGEGGGWYWIRRWDIWRWDGAGKMRWDEGVEMIGMMLRGLIAMVWYGLMAKNGVVGRGGMMEWWG